MRKNQVKEIVFSLSLLQNWLWLTKGPGHHKWFDLLPNYNAQQ